MFANCFVPLRPEQDVGNPDMMTTVFDITTAPLNVWVAEKVCGVPRRASVSVVVVGMGSVMIESLSAPVAGGASARRPLFVPLANPITPFCDPMIPTVKAG